MTETPRAHDFSRVECVRVTAIPPGLPHDDVDTPGVFAKCVGKSFEVTGRNGELLELAVGEVMGVAPAMHSIWIEPHYTDALLPSYVSRRKLWFVIDSVEFRIPRSIARLPIRKPAKTPWPMPETTDAAWFPACLSDRV